MKRIVFAFILLVAACSPNRQRLRMEPYRVLYQSADVQSTAPTELPATVRTGFMGKNLIVRYPDGRSEKISKKTIWGYSDKKGRVYRYYRRSYYQVVHMGELVQYERTETHNYMVGNQMTSAPSTATYYSKTLDSRIFGSRKRASRDPEAAGMGE